jgi:hypothetical protein
LSALARPHHLRSQCAALSSHSTLHTIARTNLLPMSYRPLADSPEEHIALRARRVSHDDDRGLDGEDDIYDTSTPAAEEVDLYVKLSNCRRV